MWYCNDMIAFPYRLKSRFETAIIPRCSTTAFKQLRNRYHTIVISHITCVVWLVIWYLLTAITWPMTLRRYHIMLLNPALCITDRWVHHTWLKTCSHWWHGLSSNTHITMKYRSPDILKLIFFNGIFQAPPARSGGIGSGPPKSFQICVSLALLTALQRRVSTQASSLWFFFHLGSAAFSDLNFNSCTVLCPYLLLRYTSLTSFDRSNSHLCIHCIVHTETFTFIFTLSSETILSSLPNHSF